MQSKPQFTFEGGHMVMYQEESAGLPQTLDATVNDRDRMQDLLAQEKYMTVGYNIALNEASHDELFQVLKENADTCHQMQRQVFDTMFQKGWYKLPVADAQAMAHAYEQFQQWQSQFPFQQGQTAAAGGMQMGMQERQKGDQQLQQQVEKALQVAQQGRVPTGYGVSRRKH